MSAVLEIYTSLSGVHYLECVSYARLRIKVVSQLFCVDQLNPAGFNVPNVLIRKTPHFIPARELCKRKHCKYMVIW